MRRHARKTTGIRRGLLSLVVLALLTLTIGSVGFSGASYTGPSANPNNVFTTGTLLHSNSQDGSIAIAASNMAPGDSSVGTMTVTGGGTVGGRYTLAASGLVDNPSSPRLSDTLRLTVEDRTGTLVTLYTGPMSGFSSVSMGTIAVGATRTYRVTLTYPAGTNVAALQGASSSLDLGVTGVSP
jgi:hypothetical protein